MIPVSNQLKNVEVVEQPSLCPRMIVESERIIGQCDDVEAIKQAIYNILNTERYQYIIFSWDYGVELKDLFGKPIDYVMPEVERRITEALVQDDRIDSCDSFEFEKKGRNVVLTRYGKMFLPYVEESLKVLNEGVQRIQEVNGSRHGIIHLAYIYTMGSEFVPKLVRKFLDAYPDYDIEFHFTVGTTGEIIDGLKDDKYDIVFSSYKDGEQDIDFKKIANQKLVLAVPMDHPLSIKDSVDLRDTIEYPQIYFEKGSGLRPVIDQMFEEIGQFPKVAFEMEEDSSMAGLVAQGFGIAVMPDIPILRSLSVKTLDIYNPPYERAVYLATLKQRYLSPVAKAFIRFVIEETA